LKEDFKDGDIDLVKNARAALEALVVQGLNTASEIKIYCRTFLTLSNKVPKAFLGKMDKCMMFLKGLPREYHLKIVRKFQILKETPSSFPDFKEI
jgi:hypothetical protein